MESQEFSKGSYGVKEELINYLGEILGIDAIDRRPTNGGEQHQHMPLSLISATSGAVLQGVSTCLIFSLFCSTLDLLRNGYLPHHGYPASSPSTDSQRETADRSKHPSSTG